MQAIVIKTGEVVEVEKTATYCATWSGGKRIYNESELLFEPSTKIDGWVARNATGKILFFKGKQVPSKPNYEKLPKQWHGSAPPDNGIPIVPQSAFPEVTWDSEPLEVTIIIKPKEK